MALFSIEGVFTLGRFFTSKKSTPKVMLTVLRFRKLSLLAVLILVL